MTKTKKTRRVLAATLMAGAMLAPTILAPGVHAASVDKLGSVTVTSKGNNVTATVTTKEGTTQTHSDITSLGDVAIKIGDPLKIGQRGNNGTVDLNADMKLGDLKVAGRNNLSNYLNAAKDYVRNRSGVDDKTKTALIEELDRVGAIGMANLDQAKSYDDVLSVMKSVAYSTDVVAVGTAAPVTVAKDANKTPDKTNDDVDHAIHDTMPTDSGAATGSNNSSLYPWGTGDTGSKSAQGSKATSDAGKTSDTASSVASDATSDQGSSATSDDTDSGAAVVVGPGTDDGGDVVTPGSGSTDHASHATSNVDTVTDPDTVVHVSNGSAVASDNGDGLQDNADLASGAANNGDVPSGVVDNGSIGAASGAAANGQGITTGSTNSGSSAAASNSGQPVSSDTVAGASLPQTGTDQGAKALGATLGAAALAGVIAYGVHAQRKREN